MLQVHIRTLILYLALIVGVRLLGKRQIGQMEPTEFVITMLLANLATLPLEDPDFPLLYGLGPLGLVVLGELLFSLLTLKSIKIRKLFCSKPVILMENGQICEKAMRRNRINLDELTMHLREKGIYDLETVKFAILETNGQLSTLLYARHEPPSAGDANIHVKDTELPITLISDGRILEENLILTGKDRLWLDRELERRGCQAKQVLLLTRAADGKIYFSKKEGR